MEIQNGAPTLENNLAGPQTIKHRITIITQQFYSYVCNPNEDICPNKNLNLNVSLQFSSIAQSCPTLRNLMNCSTPGLPVHHQLPAFTQTHVHRVMMPSSHLVLCRPLLLLPPIPPSIRVFSNESPLRMKWPKYWSFSFSIIPSKEHPGLFSFRWTGWISLQSKGLSRVFSNTTVQKHQFFDTQLSSQSNSHIHTKPCKNHSLD